MNFCKVYGYDFDECSYVFELQGWWKCSFVYTSSILEDHYTSSSNRKAIRRQLSQNAGN